MEAGRDLVYGGIVWRDREKKEGPEKRIGGDEERNLGGWWLMGDGAGMKVGGGELELGERLPASLTYISWARRDEMWSVRSDQAPGSFRRSSLWHFGNLRR